MINQVIVMGRLVDNPEIREMKDGNKSLKITLAVPRPYRNAEGVYETDYIDCYMFKGIANNVGEYTEKGDLLAVKGCLKKLSGDKEMRLVAEKVTFLASKKEEEK